MATPFQGAPEATLTVEIDVSELPLKRFKQLASRAASLSHEVSGEALASRRRRSPGPPPFSGAYRPPVCSAVRTSLGTRFQSRPSNSQPLCGGPCVVELVKPLGVSFRFAFMKV